MDTPADAPIDAPADTSPVEAPGLSRRAALQIGGTVLTGAALASCANSGTSNVRTSSAAGVDGALIPLDEVPVGGVAAVTIDRRPAFVARPDANTVRAFSGVCTHQHCTVVAAGDLLLCPCHGSHFELLTGAVTRGPAEADLPSIAVRIEADSVVLE